MVKRIVKLTFHRDKIADFLEVFKSSHEKIAAFEGCSHLELLREEKDGNIFFTYSYWEGEAALNKYRKSELFKNTWAKTKILFIDKPEAWTVEEVIC